VPGRPGSDAPDRRRLQAALCERVRTLAADKAPIPVVLLTPGDPGLIAADTAVLLFHANVQPSQAQERAAAGLQPARLPRHGRAVRAVRRRPRATALPTGSTQPDRQFDAAVNAALAETLPWRSPPTP
jgi:hypothetical protein